jgi:phasin family protein
MDFAKMFDMDAMGKVMDMSTWTDTQKKSWESAQQLSDKMTKNLSAYTERQMQMVQSSMENSIEATRELATSQGIEEYMNRQSEIVRKNAETMQSNAKELADMVKKSNEETYKLMQKQWQDSLNAFSSCCAKKSASK